MAMWVVEQARREIEKALHEISVNHSGLIAHAIANDLFDREGFKQVFRVMDQRAKDDMLLQWEAIAEVVIREKVLGGPPIDG